MVTRCAATDWLPRDAAEQRFQALFEHAGMPLVVCDRTGLVVAANTAAAGLFNQVPAKMIGRSLSHWVKQPGATVVAIPAADATVTVTVTATAAATPSPTSGTLHNGEAELHIGGPEPRPVALHISALPWAGIAAALPEEPAGTHRRDPHAQWLISLRDHSDKRKAQEHLTRLATLDSLTQLPNRTLFRDRLAQAMARAQRSGRPMALMFLDLDHFKVVNDGLGHEAGDELLRHVAFVLSRSLREVDSVLRMVDVEPCTLSRLGGDEFTIIAEGIGGAEDARMIALRLLEALRTPYRLRLGTPEAEDVVVSASIGISLYPHEDVDLDDLVKRTDMAMYSAKALGRGTYTFYNQKLSERQSERLALEGGLRRASERLATPSAVQEFVLHYQPTISCSTGEVVGVEALLRWRVEGRGLIPPLRFIPILEETGLIFEVGAWVIREACRQLHEWDLRGLRPLRMAVNLSPRQLAHHRLNSMIEDTLRDHAIAPGRLELEITEEELAVDSERSRSMLDSFKRIGVRLALDDFGVGQTNLARLGLVGVDTLKIDRSFVSGVPEVPGEIATGLNEDPKKLALSSTVIGMARSMGIGNVIAEGVETEAQAERLRELGCDEMQGYLFSRPLPPEDLVRWLEARAHQALLKRLSVGRSPDEPLQRLRIHTEDVRTAQQAAAPVVGHLPPALAAAASEDLGGLAPSWAMLTHHDTGAR